MKLETVLAEILYENKTLELPGIGIFSVYEERPVDPDSMQEKITEQPVIHFQQTLSSGSSDQLISLISQKTGKMRSLAEADLNSFLELAKQILNIGKPLHIEGIGNLYQGKNGVIFFTQESPGKEKLVPALKKRTL